MRRTPAPRTSATSNPGAPRPSRWARRGRFAAAPLVVAVTAALAAAPPAGAATAHPATPGPRPAFGSTITVVGHGWGHGIGMGQWGALGYALGQDGGAGNFTYTQIVDHYYGPATLATDPGDAGDARTIRVAMTEGNGSGLTVYATGPAGVTLPTGGTAQTVQFVPLAGGWVMDTSAVAGCGGPFGAQVPVANPSTEAADGGTVVMCLPAGGTLTLHGSLSALYNSLGSPRTVNTVPIGQYLDDVVPSESSAGWATLGGPGPQGQSWGFQALEAQAVAARSYALANPNSYGGYADTCDQTCQSYPGTRNEGSGGGLATVAVGDTAGQVMEFPGGAIATTEYSASTGGWSSSSAEGSPFTPVVDAGDAVCAASWACNPNHDWTVTVPTATIDATWPAIGSLLSIAITRRNGYGADGGRVVSMTLAGTAGTVAVGGIAFAIDLGLNSDWFAIPGASDVGGGASGGVGGYWLAAADGGIFAFGAAPYFGSMGGHPLNQPIVGMSPTGDGRGYWEVASDGGIFSFGDATFHGSMGGRPLNAPIVGIAVDPATGGYWEVASDGGIFSFGAPFEGSTGGLALNRPIVGMAPTPDGKGYWLVASDGGIFAFGDAAFYGSTGSLALTAPVVAMAPTPDGHGYWLAAADGGLFTFGDAAFAGSAGGTADGTGTVDLLPTATGHGYLLVTSVGRVLSFGDAPDLGDLTTVLSAYGGRVVTAATTAS